jgi:hypothetical protein
MTQTDDPWIEGYDHGFHEATCGLCGWYGWTDTGGCERCVYCRECGQPYTDDVPCECCVGCGEPCTDDAPCLCNKSYASKEVVAVTPTEDSKARCSCCLDTGLKWEDDRGGKGWCACQAKP